MNFLIVGEIWTRLHDRLFCFDRIEDINIKANYSELRLWINGEGWVKIDGVVWRSNFNQNYLLELSLLEIIQLSTVACINSAQTVLSYGSKLSVIRILHEEGIPLNSIEARIGHYSKLLIDEGNLPIVIKLGNFHSGYGKALAPSKEMLNELIDMSVTYPYQLTTEPYIDYQRDLRCLLIGASSICIEKRSLGWKANVDPVTVEIVKMPDEIIGYNKKIMKILSADVLGIDWIKEKNGNWILLEVNLCPDLFLKDENGNNYLGRNVDMIFELLYNRISKKPMPKDSSY